MIGSPHTQTINEAEREITLDLNEVIADVPGFTLTIDVNHCQGTIVLDCGLMDTKIASGTTVTDPIAAYKIVRAAEDELCAIRFRDLVAMGLKPHGRKQRKTKNSENTPTAPGAS